MIINKYTTVSDIPEISLQDFRRISGWTLEQIAERVPFWSEKTWQSISAGQRKEKPRHRMALGLVAERLGLLDS